MRGFSRRQATATGVALAGLVLPLSGAVAAWSAPTPSPTDPTGSPSPTPTSPTESPSATPTKPPKKPDRKAPPPPSVGTPTAGAEGRITVTIGAEKGADVVVREGTDVVAQGRATGGSVTLSWTTTTGEHSYAARATDKAGNRSKPTTFSAEADAEPPPLGKVAWTVGTREDTRSSVRFRTAPDTSYRVLVDGVVVAEGTSEERVVERVVDVANGDHSTAVEVSDEVGNVASRERGLTIRIRSLAVETTVTSRPTTRQQVVQVRATPNATTGVLRVPGESEREFTLERGRATVKLRLPDDTYTDVSVSVRDSQERRGVSRVEPFEVDTSPPVLALSTDSRAAAGGRLEAVVRTEPGNRVTWRLLTPAGVTAESGTFTARDSNTTIESDVDAGSYELEVVATDDYDRTVTKTAEARIAVDPTPIWMIVLTGVAVAIGGIALVFLLPLLLKRLFGSASRRRDRRRLVVADTARREHAAERASQEAIWEGRSAVLSDFVYGVTVGWEIEPLPGFVQRPGETVRHMTVATAYESTDGDADHVSTREGALVVTGQRLVLLGDEPREWPVEDVHDLVHVGDDESVLHHAGRDERWTVISYGEPETTRLHLDHLRAEQRGEGAEHLEARRAELAGPSGREGAVDLSAWV